MEPILIYLFKMLFCSALFYGYYRLILFNRSFHQWNRFYLMASMLLAVIIPLINIPLFLPPQQAAIGQVLTELRWHGQAAATSPATILPSRSWVYIAMALVSCILFLRLITGMLKLVYYYRSAGIQQLNPQVRIILTTLKNAPFSFFHWLFWREDIDPGSDAGQRILAHELTHIGQKHSIDKLLTELLLCVFWMNPFFWLMRRELAAVHEFIADRKAIGSQDGAAFAEMILNAMQVQPISTRGLVSPFFSSQIKRRLYMITSSREPRFSYLRRISSLVLLFVALFSLAFTIRPINAQPTAAITLVKTGDTLEITSDTLFLHQTPDTEKPDALLRISTIDPIRQSPADLRLQTDSIPPLYIVDGREMSKEEVDQINPNTIVSINIAKNNEAVSRYGKRGSGGIVYILTKSGQPQRSTEPEIREVVVVGYKVKNDSTKSTVKEIQVVGKEFQPSKSQSIQGNEIILEGKKVAEPENQDVKIQFRNPESANAPMIIVDGKKINYDEMQTINPNEIEAINVLKGESATGKYGSKAVNGVIEISMKK